MKRSGFKFKPRKPLKRSPFKRTTSPKVRSKLTKRELMPNRVKRAKKELVELSHTFIRKRDSINDYEIKGYCFDCGILCEGINFQCGHFEADSVGGALLRYHPHNMHGQFSGCNMKTSQERVKINYTLKMLENYGLTYVNHLRALKNKSIKADILFYEKMVELYKEGDEQKIIDYLETLC